MSIANAHHEHLSVDCIRAYHFGSRFIVELEVLLPPKMTVEESHDIALFLQHKVSPLNICNHEGCIMTGSGIDRMNGLEHKYMHASSC